jgi:hypothetical protein
MTTFTIEGVWTKSPSLYGQTAPFMVILSRSAYSLEALTSEKALTQIVALCNIA